MRQKQWGRRHHLIRGRTVAPILRKRRFALRFVRAALKAGPLTKLRHELGHGLVGE
jgi:hypothetical protein